jgi:hypothetical protein
MKQHIINVLNRLLVDISVQIKCHLDTPDEITCEWALIEAPLLDKKLLRYIEGGQEWPLFPEWLIPLSDLVRKGLDTRWREFQPPQVVVQRLRCLRQILVFCYKAEYEPTNEQLSEAQASFQDAEKGVEVWEAALADYPYYPALRNARRIVGSIIYRIDWSEITPHHGPGGIYPSRKPWRKGDFRTIYSSIQPHYPFDQYFSGLPWTWEALEKLDCRYKLEDCIVANLVAVPKDSRGPRLICVHPAECIWIQQGQRALLESRIETHPLTRGRISFRDQTVNGKIALSSSSSREFCTLDLKEASDRISCQLVKFLFGTYAYDKISCTRATHVRLLDGTLVPLKKWAPMGNALCFPVESLVFYALVVSGILSRYGENCSEVYVFGDDIIFPSKYYDGVISVLVSVGLIPNQGKTFVKGFFRESCGVEAFGGFDITPLRLKKSRIVSLADVVSHLDLASRLRRCGYDVCASYIYSLVRSKLGYLPLCNNPSTNGLVEYVNLPATTLMIREPMVFFHEDTQQLAVRHKTCSQRLKVLSEHDWYHVQDSIMRITRGGSDRQTEYPIPYRERLEYGWTEALPPVGSWDKEDVR